MSKTKMLFTHTLLILSASAAILLISMYFTPQPSNSTPTDLDESRAAGIPAFPGAEGFGAQSVGGRGGKIIAVTNLNDSGPGSLRDAVTQSGPRTIIFKISGYIKLADKIVLSNPYITIAGQTAPGQGIAIRKGSITIATHDVIIRGMKYRVGDELGNPPGRTRDGINISASSTGQEIYNIIIDSSSISWGVDENVSTWTNKVKNVTVQWSIISEALKNSIHIDEGASTYGPHSMGFLIGDYSQNVSVHHSILANNEFRNPFIQSGTRAEVINNVIYNWNCEGTKVGDSNKVNLPSYVNIIGNYYKRGPNSCTSRKGILINDTNAVGTKVYVSRNLGPGRETDTGDDWTAVTGNQSFRSNYPAFAGSGIKTDDPTTAYELVLNHAGAQAKTRDSIDNNIINGIKNNSGKIIDCIVTCDSGDIRNAQQGFPALTSGTYPKDTDNDGLPDAWETAKGLNPNNNLDATLINSSGYSNIEEYINSLITLPTATIPISLITNLNIKDSENSADWSIQENMQTGNQMYGDRAYIITSLPTQLAGSTWIRVAADSKRFTGNPLVTFIPTRDVVVFTALDSRITNKPAWLSGWSNTGLYMTTTALGVNLTFPVYKKSYSKGQTVSLGPIGDNMVLPYPIMVQ